jgi:hypothetical protein
LLRSSLGRVIFTTLALTCPRNCATITSLLVIASLCTNDGAAQEAVYAIDLPIVGADRAAFIALKLAASAKEMSEIKKAMAPKEIARVLHVTKLQKMHQAAAAADYSSG